jgi:hypothetical protein
MFLMACKGYIVIVVLMAFAICGCQKQDPANTLRQTTSVPPTDEARTTPYPSPTPPNLQAELLGDRDKTTMSPIGSFDFKNYTYEMPRGWQNPDGTTEITLTNGKVAPVQGKVTEEMSNEAKAEEKSRRRIGLSYVTTKYMDLTGDGDDEAVVILKIETGGSAIPQIAYVFTWTAGKPELIWPFRTGDRADGGLKDIRAENGQLVLELYGQDRFILGQTETGKITDDREQLCCPTYFTRSSYKWNGKNFLLQGKRLTFSISDPDAPPLLNLGEIVNEPPRKK